MADSGAQQVQELAAQVALRDMRTQDEHRASPPKTILKEEIRHLVRAVHEERETLSRLNKVSICRFV